MMPPERNPPWAGAFGPVQLYYVPGPTPAERDMKSHREAMCELLAGDEAATLRYHGRMLDLDRRFDRWRFLSTIPPEMHLEVLQ